MKLSDYVAEFLAQKGIEFNYIFTGGAIAHVIDSCWRLHERNPNVLKPICVLHEQAGSMAIDAYTRATGKLAVMMVTSGPGATNLLTGMACSYYDSIPGIYITGQVRTWECKGKMTLRQLGFQETDIVTMSSSITNYSVLVEDPRDIRYELEKAFYLATSGRPGPVLVDLPMDVQWAEIEPDQLRGFNPPIKKFDQTKKFEFNIGVLADHMLKKEKCTIVAGGGVRLSGAMKNLEQLSNEFNMPVLTTFGGNDTFPHDNTNYCGLIGTMGNVSSNEILSDSEVVLALGTRLSWRQVRSNPERFGKNTIIVHVDIDPGEINQHIPSTFSFPLDVKFFIEKLRFELESKKYGGCKAWSRESKGRYEKTPFCLESYYESESPVNPYVFMNELSKSMESNDIAIIDAGQNVMWGMQALQPTAEQRIITAWAHSPMGYSLPGAMGVAAKYNKKGDPNVICTIGDGGFQVNIQELQTIKYYNLPVKVFILNNHSYGAIKDYQDGNLDSRYYATCPEHGYEAPDFLSISRSYGIETISIANHRELASTIKYVLEHDGPIICDVDLGSDTFVVLNP